MNGLNPAAATDANLLGNGGGSASSFGGERADRWVMVLLSTLVAIKLGFLFWFAAQARWVMDEFAQGYFGHGLEDGLYRAVDPIKTALPQWLFSQVLHGDLTSVEIFHWWRFMTLTAAMGIVVLVAVIARRLHASPIAALLSVLVLLSFSNFIESSFVVRNDSFAVTFVVAAFAVALLAPASAFSAWGPGVLAGVAFLCTQKTIYHAAALGCGMLLVGFDAGRLRGALTCGLRFAAGFALPLLIYAGAFGGSRFYEVLRAIFVSPLAFAASLSAYSDGLGRFVFQTLERNPAAYLVSAAGLAITLSRWRETPARVRAAAVATGLIVALVFAHRQPWPYVFVMALPFLAIWAPVALRRIPESRRLLGLAALLLLLAPSFARNLQRSGDTSRSQFELVRAAELQLQPGDRYFDGIGMIPTRHLAGRYPWWWWDFATLSTLTRRWDEGDRAEIGNILRDQPKLWILNYRLGAFQERLGPTWWASTVRVSEFLLLSGCRLDPGRETSFQNLWAGEYLLFDSEGKPTGDDMVVDGVSCPEGCRLAPGAHRIASPAAELRFLLPQDFVATGPLPHGGQVEDLFAGIYDL